MGMWCPVSGVSGDDTWAPATRPGGAVSDTHDGDIPFGLSSPEPVAWYDGAARWAPEETLTVTLTAESSQGWSRIAHLSPARGRYPHLSRSAGCIVAGLGAGLPARRGPGMRFRLLCTGRCTRRETAKEAPHGDTQDRPDNTPDPAPEPAPAPPAHPPDTAPTEAAAQDTTNETAEPFVARRQGTDKASKAIPAKKAPAKAQRKPGPATRPKRASGPGGQEDAAKKKPPRRKHQQKKSTREEAAAKKRTRRRQTNKPWPPRHRDCHNARLAEAAKLLQHKRKSNARRGPQPCRAAGPVAGGGSSALAGRSHRCWSLLMVRQLRQTGRAAID